MNILLFFLNFKKPNKNNLKKTCLWFQFKRKSFLYFSNSFKIPPTPPHSYLNNISKEIEHLRSTLKKKTFEAPIYTAKSALSMLVSLHFRVSNILHYHYIADSTISFNIIRLQSQQYHSVLLIVESAISFSIINCRVNNIYICSKSIDHQNLECHKNNVTELSKQLFNFPTTHHWKRMLESTNKKMILFVRGEFTDRQTFYR